MIETEGISFVVGTRLLPVVSGLRIAVLEHHGRKVLTASHPYWDGDGAC